MGDVSAASTRTDCRFPLYAAIQMQPRIHIADPPPPHCSACYQAVPEKRHVDFGASTDGPVLELAGGQVLHTASPLPRLADAKGVVGHVVDEILICETCVEEAAKLIGLQDAEKLGARLEEALAANDRLHEQLAGTRSGVTDALELVRKAAHGERAPGTPNGSIPGSAVPAAVAVARRRKAART